MMNGAFPPRPGDVPRQELLDQAQRAIELLGGPEIATVYFKYTCPACGERCQFEQPFILWERGTCCRCGHDAPVTHGGFSVKIQAKNIKNPLTPQ